MMQFYIVKDRIKKSWPALVTFFLFLLIDLLVLKFSPVTVTEEELLSILGVPNTVLKLIEIFKIGMIVYISYLISTYEFVHSPEYFLLRAKLSKWLVKKIFALLLVIFFLDLFHFLVVTLFFNGYIEAISGHFWFTLLFDVVEATLVMDYSFMIKKKPVALVLSLVLSTILFHYFSLWLGVLVFVVELSLAVYFVKNKNLHMNTV